ncbi:uncharacterized protein LTR77_009639 [Saxophila tyrrhenica]|uniref:Phosphatidic acid phosphatase type 2/haloperoxidase domain-containing protein n=1 Tax=Saxophila tyrrhenica TaxID=1690608 RepID=A0AAV9NY76_9PEZI|nr:hypothetical protein LTR77_009639 [Saxophila tyrrhenica]
MALDKVKTLARNLGLTTMSKRLVLSYVIDWLVIFLIAGLGGLFNFIEPYKRPFSLLDLSISFPYITPELVPYEYLIFICGMAPAIIIALISLLLVPGPRHCRSLNRSQIIRLKFWEFERGWAGFCLSLAIGFFITQSMKNVFGKPRPNLLERCQPDLDNIASHRVGGWGEDISARWTLVSASICTNNNRRVLDDGFRSFPSGHSSFSWSAMLYLSLFLCSKFAITIPFMRTNSTNEVAGLQSDESGRLLSSENNRRPSTDDSQDKPLHFRPASARRPTQDTTPIRKQAATPPNHLIIVAVFPLGVAIWICSTRFVEFYHFGFDIISGSLIGIASAWFSFRWYHLPIRSGQGWAWGARNPRRAFGIGVGTANYGDEGIEGSHKRTDDIELNAAR